MRVALVLCLLVVASLAGCSGKKDGGGDGDGSGDSGSQTTTGSSGGGDAGSIRLFLNLTVGNQTYRFASGNASSGGAAGSATSSSTAASATSTSAGPGNGTGNQTADGNATAPSGTAPAEVSFELGASGALNASASWTLDFGLRGNGTGNGTAGNGTAGNATSGQAGAGQANGTALPATANQTYAQAGAYNVTFVLRQGRTVESIKVTLTVGNGTGNVSAGPALPAVTHFEFGESLGCASDANAVSGGAVPPNCASFHGGPDATGIDGHWVQLSPEYWGLAFVATSENVDGSVDSDCYLVADDAATIVGDGHNGGGPCTGVVVEGTGWMFLYPWGVPSTGMTLDFSLA